jgi:hypothetical protein
MEIVDKDARRQIVKLMEPLMLTPPHKRTEIGPAQLSA